ncbi:hypothetical protein MSR1_25530 [Magnetospirillum gryphiswaldense MSR-1]|uniref:DUF2141 domain-containing protein n=1 Tax=Magnetospirillum gryphiswaldense (strain DSM 6361 / JCM 21280 / NBRC 15271 / MSR-1) TaxID=431944 RepID=V6F6C4_MAGGM|nr:hypothetical protein MSR1_25530 [Magnetospirillum gryphiswaldense MSR-1]AVM78937.1 hypothetical protein MSR1L_25530 [Magnetospirillum gryphiswaldense]CDL01075.1 conserved protein of unknown function [Magnetospirillum gryphiswaldense MSR-1 v2]
MRTGKYRALAWVAVVIGGVGSARAGDLTVILDGVAHDQGGLRVGLYDRAESFRKEDRAVAIRTAAASPGQASIGFGQVPAGRYAIMAYHDEDGDGGLDRFMGMIPTEGYALSNDPEVSGPPAFDECAFDIPAEGRAITLKLRY